MYTYTEAEKVAALMTHIARCEKALTTAHDEEHREWLNTRLVQAQQKLAHYYSLPITHTSYTQEGVIHLHEGMVW